MARRAGSNDPRAQRTRQALLDACLALVREKRVEELSIAEIVKRAGTSRQVFYEHFDDRDSAVATAVERMAAETLAPTEGNLRPSVTVAEAVGPLLRLVDEERGLYRNLHGGPVQHRAMAAARSALVPSCRALAVSLYALGGVDPDPDELTDATRFLVGGVFEALDGWMHEDLTYEESVIRATALWDRMSRLLAISGGNTSEES